jgi:hypothetical protein
VQENKITIRRTLDKACNCMSDIRIYLKLFSEGFPQKGFEKHNTIIYAAVRPSLNLFDVKYLIKYCQEFKRPKVYYG